jgi:hypothetical protein
MHIRICRLKLVLVGELVVVVAASPNVGTTKTPKGFCWVGGCVCVYLWVDANVGFQFKRCTLSFHTSGIALGHITLNE